VIAERLRRWCEFEFASHGVCLRCHLRRPLHFGGASALPLLLFLHSASYMPVLDLFPAGDTWLDGSTVEPLFVLCPRCPDNFYWLLQGNSWAETGGEWILDDRGFSFWVAPAAEEMAQALVALVHEVMRQAPVDPRRVCLSGTSMGGHACWDLAARNPGLFAALAPVAAHLESQRVAWAVEQLKGTPVWAFHGMGDFCCPFEDTVELVKKLGPPAWLTTYRGGRGDLSVHNSASLLAYVEYGPALFSWMLRQSLRQGTEL